MRLIVTPKRDSHTAAGLGHHSQFIGRLRTTHEAVQTSEDTTRTARRVFGGTHPLVAQMQMDLRNARAALRAREETQPPGDA